MSKTDISTTYPRFNRQFFKDLWALAKPFWSSPEKKRAYGYLLINLICSFGGVYVSVALNSVTKTMFDALSAFNKPVLFQSSMKFLGLAGLVFALAGYGSYYMGLLTIQWQKWLTDNTVDKWMHQQVHYHLRWLDKKVDNPDQRISEDLASFPALTLRIFFLVLKSSTSYISFSVILWGLSSHFPLVLGSLHLIIPGYLYFSATLYGLLGMWLIGIIGRKLSSIEYLQQIYNADFRHQLIRIREYSEQVALYRGEETEKKKLHLLFDRIYNIYLQGNDLRKNLVFFTIGFDIFTQIVGVFLAMPLFLAKKIQFGGMMQISGAFRSVVDAFTSIIEAFSLLAEWKAVVFRLNEFMLSMEHASKHHEEPTANIEYVEHQIILPKLHVHFPTGELMSTVTDLEFAAPHRYLIMGLTGAGKSTLFKAINGLWPHMQGTIKKPEHQHMFLLPQRSYIPHGTLYDVLTYPHGIEISEQHLNILMEECGLARFIPELYVQKNWSQVLSLGQQQLVGFVRLFIRQPQMIFLDESSSALDEYMEEKMYFMLNQRFPHAGIISIGHRKSLIKHHQYFLKMGEKGAFEMMESVHLE